MRRMIGVSVGSTGRTFAGVAIACLAAAAFAQTTTLVSLATSGVQGDRPSSTPAVSANGRFVAFTTLAMNFVEGDTNNTYDVFVRDRQTGETTLVSASSAGEQGNGWSDSASMSADGRYIAFHSLSTNLVEGDTNGAYDVFVRDRMTGLTTRVSVSSAGIPGGSDSLLPSISADGRFVAFASFASNLVPDDTNNRIDVFVHDRETGQTARVSVSSAGEQGNSVSRAPAISADGRFVAFESLASNLVPGDNNLRQDIFVHDRTTGATSRVSVSTEGSAGNKASWSPSISEDGSYVAFHSEATNLVSDDANLAHDVFVHDRQTGQTARVSVSSAGVEGNGPSMRPAISADGRFVAFHSLASNLVNGDTNARGDIFLHDRATGTTTRVSVSSSDGESDGDSDFLAISADGRVIAFDSHATNLVPNDLNGSQDVFVRETTPPPCPGDADGNGTVTFGDVTAVLANFGNDYSPATGPGDADGNGVVNFGDITTVLANFGAACS